jgi:hypothetical protein
VVAIKERYPGHAKQVGPNEWMNDFPEVAKISAELRKAVLERFGRSFFGLR